MLTAEMEDFSVSTHRAHGTLIAEVGLDPATGAAPSNGDVLQIWNLRVPALIAVRPQFQGGNEVKVSDQTVWLEDDVSRGGPYEYTEPRSAEAIMADLHKFFVSDASSDEFFRDFKLPG